MSLDITFTRRSNVICPHCGTVVTTIDENSAYSGGRSWYPILEELGYYVPYDKRTDENDWYGKDMVLTNEQIDKVYKFIRENSNLYYADTILELLAVARYEEHTVVVNADW